MSATVDYRSAILDEEHRGKGLGRATMQAAEDYVMSQGAKRLALNLFGPNRVARSLHELMGYKVMAIEMRIDLVCSADPE
jgi:GNAT superfamily N-acetyltransferase